MPHFEESESEVASKKSKMSPEDVATPSENSSNEDQDDAFSVHDTSSDRSLRDTVRNPNDSEEDFRDNEQLVQD